jgi:hypothetical protein
MAKKKKKKVIKTTVKKPKARKADSLPTMVITPTGSKYGDEPFVRTRKIPKDVTRRTPRAVPQRRQTPPPVPSRLRGRPAGRPALDTSMLLAPLGAGPAIRAAGRGAKGARKALKKPRRKGLGAGLGAGAAIGAGLGPLGMVGGALASALSGRPAMSGLRKLSAAKAAKDKRGVAKRKKPRKRLY